MKKTIFIICIVTLLAACGKTENLFKAIAAGDVQRVEQLVKAGANVNAKVKIDTTPAMAAIGLETWGGETEGTPLLAAIGYCGKDKKVCAEMINILAKGGADVNADMGGWPMPVMMANFLDGETYAILLNARANPEAVGAEYLDTPLMTAAMGGNIDVMKLLLAAKVDVNKKDIHGEGAISSAAGCINRDPKICADAVNLLVKAGADVNSPSKKGFTPLITAAMSGNPYTVDALIKAGAKVNVKTETGGFTPLMLLGGANKEVVEILLKAGADPKAKNNKGETAAQMALKLEKNRLETAERIRSGAVKELDSIYIDMARLDGTTPEKAREKVIQEELDKAKNLREIYNILIKAEQKK